MRSISKVLDHKPGACRETASWLRALTEGHTVPDLLPSKMLGSCTLCGVPLASVILHRVS